MILRSAFAAAALAGGLVAFSAGSQAQNYPAQSYPPYGAAPSYPYRPVPGATVPDDDDDDIPANQRAAPGSYPPPQGYRGGYAYEPRPQGGQLPPPGAPAPYYGNQPPAYGNPPPAVAYGGRPVGNGQPESYGAAPPAYAPNQGPPQGEPYPQQGYQQGYPQQGYQQAPGPMQLGPGQQRPPGDVAGRDTTGTVRPNTVATLPPEEQPEDGKVEMPAQFKRQIVNFQSNEPAGTIVIDTANTYLYLILGNGQAMRYGIGVGREGFTWAGAERVSRMAEWPDWHPPSEMIERQPYLPRFMAGGEGNPLGARALYLGKTLYRIHGTNQPSTIGKYVSSGCIRLVNEDVADLYSRVQVGTRVVVLPGAPPATAANIPPQQPVQQR